MANERSLEQSDQNFVPLLLASAAVSIMLSWIGLVSDFWRWLEPGYETESLETGFGAFVAVVLLGGLAIVVHIALHGLLLPFVVSKKYRLPLLKELTSRRRGYTSICGAAALTGATAVGFCTEFPLLAALPFSGNVLVYAFWLTLIGARTRRSTEAGRLSA